MDITEIVAMIPEDKREPVKAELAAYVKIGAREDAEKLAREHPHVKSVVDSWISKAVQSHDERFVAEKLPSLVEGEILKRNPPKDPRDQKLAEMESKMKDMERQGIIKEQTARAIAKAAEAGIPADIARRYIGATDAETDAAIESLAGALVPWRDAFAKQAVLERIGNNGTPRAGNTPDAKKLMEQRYAELLAQGKREEAAAVYIQLGRMQ